MLTSQYVESVEQLRELWAIDKAAYQDLSLEFEPFLHWWSRYPMGARLLLFEGKIVASMGIYPLYPQQAETFIAGEIRESSLEPVMEAECQQGIQHWYFSGIVVVEQWRYRGLLLPLLETKLKTWANSGHLAYPLTLCGLAEYGIGAKILDRLGFTLHRKGIEMPDGCDLYCKQVFNHKTLEPILQPKVLFAEAVKAKRTRYSASISPIIKP